MRRLLVALALIGLVSDASAEEFEFPTLRGSSPFIPAPPTYTRWSGFYVGGQAGYGSTHMNFTPVTGFSTMFSPLNTFLAAVSPVSGWAAFSTDEATGASFGGFVGFNGQWDNVVLGLEVNYNHASLSGSSTSAPPAASAIRLGDGNLYDVALAATAALQIKDYTALRARAGWVAGVFLPYVAIGLEVSRAELTRSASASGTPTGAAGTPFAITESNRINQVAWGYSAALGVDVAVWSNLFLRAEYEFVQFLAIAHVTANNHTVRVGAGYKF